MRHTVQALAATPATPSTFDGPMFDAAVTMANGQVTATMLIDARDDTSIRNGARQERNGYAAAVTSVTGGDVYGIDMYGHEIVETLAPGATSKYTFGQVFGGPSDVEWTNTFGLPYMYESDSSSEPVTYVGAAVDGDPRGTVTHDDPSALVIELDYLSNVSNPHGLSLRDRFATPDPVAPVEVSAVLTVSTDVAVPSTLVMSVPNIADQSLYVNYTMPDNRPMVYANGSGEVTYNVSELWISKYTRSTLEAVASSLVRGITDNGTMVNVTTTVA